MGGRMPPRRSVREAWLPNSAARRPSHFASLRLRVSQMPFSNLASVSGSRTSTQWP